MKIIDRVLIFVAGFIFAFAIGCGPQQKYVPPPPIVLHGCVRSIWDRGIHEDVVFEEYGSHRIDSLQFYTNPAPALWIGLCGTLSYNWNGDSYPENVTMIRDVNQ